MLPEAGQLVHVRSRPFLVEAVAAPPEPGEDTLVHLSCLADDAQGQPLSVLWEREVDARILSAAGWSQVAAKGFDDAATFSAYLHTLRWGAVTSTNADLFQAPYRAGIEVKAYQLEPLRKALALPRVNLFIADDVGLGKTIEAGLILRELILRQRIRRVVIACPPSVVRQWQEEMAQRFGIPFVVYDRAFVAERRRERGFGINPWNTHTRFIISHALLRDEAYAGPLRDWLGHRAPGSLLILDEAHNVAPSSSSRYAVDSRTTRSVRDIAPRFEHRLFLSATPHNGHSNSFAALLELLDPQRFCRGVPVKDPAELAPVMVRRLKKELRALGMDFPKREVLPISLDNLPADAPELRLPALLDQYRALRDARLAHLPKGKQRAAQLITINLQKRLLSSTRAFCSTLKVHQRALERQAGGMLPDIDPDALDLLLEPPGADDERSAQDADAIAAEEAAQVEAATALAESEGEGPTSEEITLLEGMRTIAESHQHRPGAKVKWLIRWIDENLCPGADLKGQKATGPAPRWNNRRLLIFTEYAESLTYLRLRLEEALAHTEGIDDRIDTFTGQTGEDERERIKAAFNKDPSAEPLRILLATDAAREGVNLQNHCYDLLHFDIPWNPSRLEQRNGRIDRKLQRSPVVYCRYFLFPQRPEDRVLKTLVQKTDRIRQQLGSLSPVVERRLSGLMEAGIPTEGATTIASNIDATEGTLDPTVSAELESTRAGAEGLARKLGELEDILRISRDWLGYASPQLCQALRVALTLIEGGSLEKDGDGGRFRLHGEDTLLKDPTWAPTLDTLRRPIKRGEAPWQWRKDAPIRPLVFEDPGSLDGEVVHLHLEHPLTQRLLGQLRAQGFQRHDLSRATVALSEDPEPEVILIGRLSLYGDGGTRLHEALIATSSRWIEPSARGSGQLTPSKATSGDILSRIDRALSRAQDRPAPESARRHLAPFAQGDADALLPHLKRLAEGSEDHARSALRERGTKESKEMADIIQAQLKRIRTQAENTQLGLDFKGESARQLKADKRHWERRIPQLMTELEAEPEAIRKGYEVRARRLEPVGIVYLWPRSR